MKRKIINLRQQLKNVLDQAQAALEAGNSAEFDTQMAEPEFGNR